MRLARYVVATLALISLASASLAQKEAPKAASSAGTGANDMTATLQALEIKVNDAIKNRDTKTFLSLVDPNGWLVDEMGFTPVSQLVGIIKDMTVKSYSIEGYKATMIDKNTYLTTFTWKGDETYKGEAGPPLTYCSSIWVKRGNDWKAVFHQETLPMTAEGTQAPEGKGSH